MQLSLNTRKIGQSSILDLDGRLIFGEECDLLRREVKDQLVSSENVILNLRNVQYVDSGGIGCLVGLYTTARNQGRELRLAGGNEKVQHVLKITKLISVLGLHPDEASALASVQGRATA